MNEPVTEADGTLLFEWGPPKGEKFLISAFLIGSLFLHAIAFYVFRIIYPPAIAVLPPPARVNFVAADTDEGRTLLRWIEAEDPALASATMRPAETRSRSLPRLAHVPSYMVQEPKLKEPPPINFTPAVPSAFPPGPAPILRNPVESWPKMPTRVTFSNELNDLGQVNFAAAPFTGSTGETPENVRFRIGVNPLGVIRYCFRLNSSGDSALDEQARLRLIHSRFAAKRSGDGTDDGSLVWGIATIEWGNDVQQPARAPTPAPP
jgi:hypothetical protein